MGGDASNRRCIAALWTLVETAAGRAPTDLGDVAAAASATLAQAMGDESYLIVHENCGAIFVDGHLIPLAVDVFAAAKGLAERMQAHGVGEILFDRHVDAADLAHWASGFAAAAEGTPGPTGEARIHVGVRGASSEPVMTLGRQRAATEVGDSRLRAVYLENQLMAVVDERRIAPGIARCVLHGVVESLLLLPGGLEPLTLLQGEPKALRQALHVAIVAVHLARLAGWPESRLGELGAVALLHDVGALLDPARPGEAGMAWLLERGTEDFWLRCAFVSASWRQQAEEGAGEWADLLTLDLVRLAVRHWLGRECAPVEDPELDALARAGAATLGAASGQP
ncbi:MAG: hypothetical protein H6838_08790 [Planctomycetes bacterium]|nr:hypothetical protein [Planctomycetota bacterium]